MTKYIAMIGINLVAPKAGAERELLLNKLASVETVGRASTNVLKFVGSSLVASDTGKFFSEIQEGRENKKSSRRRTKNFDNIHI